VTRNAMPEKRRPTLEPRATIDLRIGDLSKGAVRVLSFLNRGRPVGRRAHQRMTKPHAGAELEQASLCRRRRSLGTDREPLGCSPHQHRVAEGIGRRELRRTAGSGRQDR
jgi:hypothetical protein